jgi:hypothetical protein
LVLRKRREITITLALVFFVSLDFRSKRLGGFFVGLWGRLAAAGKYGQGNNDDPETLH